MELRPYQIGAINSFKLSSAKRKLIVLPTGTGKTVTGLSLALDIGGRCLWLAHRDELITQPMRTLQSMGGNVTMGIVKADQDQWMRDFVFASVQTACREARLEKLCRKPFDLVVVDEAHHVSADSYKRVLEGVGCFREGGPQLLGITATPERTDQSRLDDTFERVVYQYHLHQAVADGYLVPPTIVSEPININLDSVGLSGGDYKQGELDLALLESGIVEAVTAAYLAHATDRKSIIFTVGVKQAELIAEAIRGQGHACAAVSGETPQEERRKILRDFSTGKLRCVTNCMVLTEGFDEPTADCIIMARPTQAKSLYIQCVGRGLRISPMKQDCKIVDMVGLTGRHTMVQAPVIFGLEPDEPVGEREQRLFDGDAREFWRSRLSTQASGVSSITRSALVWVRGDEADRVFLLGCGYHGTVRMERVGEEDEWDVAVIGNRATNIERMPLSSSTVSAELAQGLAEDYVRRCNAVGIAGGGGWRKQRASEAQLEALRKWGVAPPTGLTKGEASDMLTAVTSKGYDRATEKQIRYLRRLGHDVDANMTKRQAGRLIAEAKR